MWKRPIGGSVLLKEPCSEGRQSGESSDSDGEWSLYSESVMSAFAEKEDIGRENHQGESRQTLFS